MFSFSSPAKRVGAGMKGKVGQTLSHGLPMVSTSIGAEGIELIINEKHSFITGVLQNLLSTVLHCI